MNASAVDTLQEVQQTIETAKRMKEVGRAMRRYAADHEGMFPDRIEELVLGGYVTEPLLFLSASTPEDSVGGGTRAEIADEISRGNGLSYTYTGKGLNNQSPTDCWLLYEEPYVLPSGQKRFNVLHVDGTVEVIFRERIERSAARIKAGQNPPP